MHFSHLFQAVPPSRSSCTPPRSPPTVALSPPFTPAACWTETWGEFHLSLVPSAQAGSRGCVSVCMQRQSSQPVAQFLSSRKRLQLH